jgi:hypothetical protein
MENISFSRIILHTIVLTYIHKYIHIYKIWYVYIVYMYAIPMTNILAQNNSQMEISLTFVEIVENQILNLWKTINCPKHHQIIITNTHQKSVYFA